MCIMKIYVWISKKLLVQNELHLFIYLYYVQRQKKRGLPSVGSFHKCLGTKPDAKHPTYTYTFQVNVRDLSA